LPWADMPARRWRAEYPKPHWPDTPPRADLANDPPPQEIPEEAFLDTA